MTETFSRNLLFVNIKGNKPKASGSNVCYLFSELYARTIFDHRYCYIYVVPILLVIMPETASAPSSTRDRPTKRYRCSICGKSFDSAETFDSHQRFEHSEPGHSKPLAGVG